MKYLLDSNTVSDIYNSSSINHRQVIKKLMDLKDEDEIFISILTLYEFEYALANSPDDKRQTIEKTIEQIKEDFTILPLSIRGAEIFGKLKKLFKDSQTINQENLRKHTVDLMIAATALDHSIVLVSADKIYQAVYYLNTRLILENWTC